MNRIRHEKSYSLYDIIRSLQAQINAFFWAHQRDLGFHANKIQEYGRIFDWFDSTNSIEQARNRRNDWVFGFIKQLAGQVTKGTALEIGFGGAGFCYMPLRHLNMS